MAITSSITAQADPLVRFREARRMRREYMDIRDQLILVRRMAAGDVGFYFDVDALLEKAEERLDFFEGVMACAARELGSARILRKAFVR